MLEYNYLSLVNNLYIPRYYYSFTFRKTDSGDANERRESATKAYPTNSPPSLFAAESIEATSASSIKSTPTKKSDFCRLIDDQNDNAEVEKVSAYDTNAMSGSDILMRRQAESQKNTNDSMAKDSSTTFQNNPKDLSMVGKPNGLGSSFSSSSTVCQLDPTDLASLESTKSSVVKSDSYGK